MAKESLDPGREIFDIVAKALRLLDRPRASLLVLGTIHFADPGLDAVGSSGFDVHARAGEIDEVIERLARFEPSVVAVEWPKEDQSGLDRGFADRATLSSHVEASEVVQLGFRLAERVGVSRLHAVDVWGREYEPPIDLEGESGSKGIEGLLGVSWAALRDFGVWLDDLIKERSLREVLLTLNHPDVVRISHGVYLAGAYRLVTNTGYPGPDHVSGWWYNRNLRIFANVLDAITGPDDRIVLIIGLGHVPILRHAALASHEVQLVEVEDILG